MTIRHYVYQIDNLFWTGQLQGSDLLEMHQRLQAFMAGKVKEKTLQAKIDQYDRGWMP